MSESIIRISHLNKTFGTGVGAVLALEDINLDIHPGEIFGIIGLSGAGKSTLVRCMIPNVTSEVDIAVINGNYALEAGFSSAKDALALEDASSEAAKTFANIIVVKEGHEKDPAVLALVKALQSDAVRDYINNTFNGNVLPVF